eukprot:TRINITY_DN1055_c0_g1_i4.p1 TRINITY_DN1055_c0_g1~~TRINITY_DN1055_c0_g1_i4.p1  ORF type:complete len:1417 (+),score=252.45 TRINITY_DN1055_c0_g1_i4:39-4289(+)
MALPKVIVGFLYLIKALGVLTVITCLPTWLYMLFVVKAFGSPRKTIDDSMAIHAALSLPRWLFSTMAFPFWAGQWAGLGYGISVSVSLVAGIVVAVCGAISSIIGFVYLWRGDWFKCFPKFKWMGDEGYWHALYQGWKDFCTWLALLFCIVTVIRIPCLIIALTADDKVKKWRIEILYQALMGAVDILLLPVYIFCLLFPLRIRWGFNKFEIHKMDAYKFTTSFKVRGMAITIVFQGIADYFSFFFAFILCLMAPWNFTYWNVVENQATGAKYHMNEYRKRVLKGALWSCCDILIMILCLITVIPTLYRIPFLCMVLYRNTIHDRRAHVVFQCLCIFVDIITLILGSFVLLTVYRIFEVIKEQGTSRIQFGQVDDRGKTQGVDLQLDIMLQGVKVIGDFPFLLMAIITTLCVWRAPFMWIEWRDSSRPSEKRKVVAIHFGLLFLDFADLPFIICSLILLLTGWRAPALIKELKSDWDEKKDKGRMTARNSMRLTAITQFLYWLADFPTSIAFFIVVITGYRAKDTITLLDKLRKNYFGGSADGNNANNNNNNNDDENPAPKETGANAWSWHTIVWKQFALIMLDVPFPILALLTLWRLPWLIMKLYNECDNASERRIAVLKYLLKTMIDIPCALLFVLLCLSWRITGVVDLFKNYKTGDNEHKALFFLFLEFVIDLPFFLLAVLLTPFLWRSIPMVMAFFGLMPGVKLPAEEERAWFRRILIASLFGVALLDVLFVFLTILSFLLFWRVPSLVEFFMHPRGKYDEPWRNTLVWYEAVLSSLFVSLYDFWSLFQLIVIFIGVYHVPDLLKRGYLITKALFIDYEDFKAKKLVHTAKETKDIDYALDQMKFENTEMFTLTPFRSAIANEFLASLRDLPQHFLIPIKLVGIVFLPIHLLLSWRLKKKDDKFVHTQSFLSYPLYWIHNISVELMNYMDFHRFSILNLYSAVIIIPSELTIIVVAINSLFAFIFTLGDPVWKNLRHTFGWIALGASQGGCLGFMDTFILVLNLVSLPVFLALQLVILMIPVWCFVLMTLPMNDWDSYWYYVAYDMSTYWNSVNDLPGWVWIIQSLWIVTTIAGVQLSAKHIMKVYELYNPIIALLWLKDRVLQKRVWGFIRGLLTRPTQFAYKHRNDCGCLGEILIAPVFLIWVFWPIVIPLAIMPFYDEWYYFWILSIPIIVFLLWAALWGQDSLIRQYWRTIPKVVISNDPKIQVNRIEISYYDGFYFRITGMKDPSLVFTQAKLFFEGQEFWDCLPTVAEPKMIGMFRAAFYPISLVPTYLNPSDINNKNGRITFELGIPSTLNIMGKEVNVKKKTIDGFFQKIVDAGDPTVEFIVEYSNETFGYKKHGYIVKFKTKFSHILNATNSKALVLEDTGNDDFKYYDTDDIPEADQDELTDEIIKITSKLFNSFSVRPASL